MNTKRFDHKRVSAFVAGLAITLSAAQVQAAPGALSQTPLFLAQSVQPNIMFLLDDSGSMNWEVMRRNDGDDGSQYFDFTPNNSTERLELCHGYNVLAYDPTANYSPWSGIDVNGDSFADADPENARVNPYTGGASTSSCDSNGTINNYSGRTCDLINGFGGDGAYYFVWTDGDGDELYDSDECPTDTSDRVYVSSLTAAEQTNFANWFSYYRKREYVMKRAVSQIITESRDRLGLATLNKNDHIETDDEVGTQVKDVDDLTLPINADAVVNKATLLDNLFGVDSSSGTPLRINLQRIGQYFMDQMDNTSLFGYTPDDDSDSASGHSPILNADLGGTCQQNFAVVLSDGFWNGSTSPSVGNADSDSSSDFDGQSYSDGTSNTLADVAMHYYETDLLDIADEVPTVSIFPGSDADQECYDANGDPSPNCFDTNNQQHLVTFTVAFGVRGTIPEKDGSGNDCVPGNRHESLATQNWPTSCGAANDGWPAASGNSSTTVDDMMHAAWNGRGLFLSAKSPDELIRSLQEAIGNISSRNPVSASAVAVDTFNIIGGGFVFQGRFDASNWSGELYSNTIDSSGVGGVVWSAHDLLEAMDINTRLLVTYNGTIGLPFEFPSDYTDSSGFGDTELSQQQVDDLMFDAPHDLTTTDTTEIAENQSFAEDLVAYLRGDTSNEGTGVGDFRERNGRRLGDIINSSPVYVGNPSAILYPETIAPDSYQAWANNTSSDADPGANGRREMVYVGANDGALHAFDASTGAEVFAYYPQAVFSDQDRLGLHWLADPDYEHRYYVDIDPVVNEVYVDTGDADGLTWRTLLVGGLRGGGRAIYAIDVSDPSEFVDANGVAENILWEFTHDDLGYTFSRPTIAKLNDDRWAAIFGNGYNPTGASATGRAALFIKYLDTASPSFRVLYTDEGSINNGDCDDAGSDCNGLSTPAVVDLGADRIADRVYAGDIQGNMWVFDISSDDPANWGIPYGTSLNPDPLFVAHYLDGGGNSQRQPITSQPMVTLHPTERQSETFPNTMVFFGTGQYIAENDPISDGTNSFYGIWDSGASVTLDRNAASPDLVEQTITVGTLAGNDVRLISNNPVDYDEVKGWFMDLPEARERVIVDALVFGDLVIFTTMVPFSNLCSDSAGYSWTMALNLADGSEPDFIALDIDGSGTFDSNDQVGDRNVGGVKSGDLYWQPSLVKSGHGAIGTLLLPTDNDTGITEMDVQGAINKGTRSSWGFYRHE